MNFYHTVRLGAIAVAKKWRGRYSYLVRFTQPPTAGVRGVTRNAGLALLGPVSALVQALRDGASPAFGGGLRGSWVTSAIGGLVVVLHEQRIAVVQYPAGGNHLHG